MVANFGSSGLRNGLSESSSDLERVGMRVAVVGGAGAMGAVTATDLIRNGVDVVVVDPSQNRAESLASRWRAEGFESFILRPGQELAKDIEGCDAVVNAAGHTRNLAVMQACLDAGAHYTDLGGLFHVAIAQYALDEAFRSRGLSAAISMGSAPGLTNMLAARAISLAEMSSVYRVDIADAVVPGREYSPAEAWAPPYSAESLIEEYSADAPQYLDGAMVALPAVSGGRGYQFGDHEVTCFHTIHSEPATLSRSFEHMGIRDVTWRLGLAPADHDRLESFRAAGLMSEDPIRVDGTYVIPRDVLAAVLSRQVTRQVGTADPGAVEWFRVVVEGLSLAPGAGERAAHIRVTTDVEVRDVPGVGFPGGAWATGVPPAIAAILLGRGDALRAGVGGPEVMLPVEGFFSLLAERHLVPTDVVEVLGVPERD